MKCAVYADEGSLLRFKQHCFKFKPLSISAPNQPVNDECKHELHCDWLFSHNPSHTYRSLKGTVAVCLIPN